MKIQKQCQENKPALGSQKRSVCGRSVSVPRGISSILIAEIADHHCQRLNLLILQNISERDFAVSQM